MGSKSSSEIYKFIRYNYLAKIIMCMLLSHLAAASNNLPELKLRIAARASDVISIIPTLHLLYIDKIISSLITVRFGERLKMAGSGSRRGRKFVSNWVY